MRLVVVDALSDAAVRFYEHHGFRHFEDTAMRLYIAIDTLRSIYPDTDAPAATSIDSPGSDDASDAPSEGQPA